jgi:ABC-type antimicrobial peptide transport system permease subunit
MAGRNFEPSDDAARHVILINQTLARRYWGDENPVGKAFLSGTTPLQIVGVVRDSYSVSLDRIDPVVYQPFGGRPFAPKAMVRSTVPGAAEAVGAIARQIDARIRTQATPLSDYIDRWASASRFGAQLAAGLGMFALALATIGMSGVFGYIVQQRTKEIGIRMALGATERQVIALVLSGTSRAVLAGLAAGFLGAIALARLLTGFLYGVSPFDLRAYAAVALALGAAGLIAAFMPARKATKIDPIAALRWE